MFIRKAKNWRITTSCPCHHYEVGFRIGPAPGVSYVRWVYSLLLLHFLEIYAFRARPVLGAPNGTQTSLFGMRTEE